VGTPALIGLDTNVLARYYVESEDDAATQRQREAARRLIESGQPLALSKSVVLELEWVLRGHYGFAPSAMHRVIEHLMSMPQVDIEDRSTVQQAAEHHRAGLDFADALHLASMRTCRAVASFDRRLLRRALRLKLQPPVLPPE
jgi:predicted nucleic-acid-binding protein